MSLLERWTPFLSAPVTLSFPTLELLADGHEPPIAIGHGEVVSPDLHRFEYTLVARPTDLARAMRAIRRIDEEPYDGTARLRLVGTDADGVEWMLGWTAPRYEIGADSWRFTGDLDSLIPTSGEIAGAPGTELRYVVPDASRMHWIFAQTVITPVEGSAALRERVLEVLGAYIRLAYDPIERVLTLRATPSLALPITYAENWISEPFRILFGQLISPRLVGRQTDATSGLVFIATTAKRIPEAGWAALWDDARMNREDFWPLYSQLLTYLALAPRAPADGLEPHTLTRYYHEIILASRGSRWVWAMTFASAIEGLVKLIAPDPLPPNQPAIDAIVAHIQGAPEIAEDLKGPAIAAVTSLDRASAMDKIRALEAQGVVTARQRKAWAKLRNSVMHGRLVSPYSDRTEDDRLIALAEMTHALTLRLVRGGSSPVAAPALEAP
ncbi:MAG: hypothetical protein QM608_11320 [Caulobacter sp.]